MKILILLILISSCANRMIAPAKDDETMKMIVDGRTWRLLNKYDCLK